MAIGNLDAVFSKLRAFVDGFGFDQRGKQGTLGDDLVGVAAEHLADKMTRAKWKRNTKATAKEKADHYGWLEPDGKPNYRTGQMLSPESIRGEAVVTHDEVRWVYGKGEPPKGTLSPRDNRTPAQRKADESVTDREKAAIAQQTRPFWGTDDQMKRKVIGEAQGAWNDYVRDNW